MKHSEFIELLNLYLDHEISPADASKLEAEVQANPDHRRLYQQYCRMQKACTLLGADFQKQPAETTKAGGKFAAFASKTPSPRRFVALYAMTGLAAAACVAFVALSRQPVKTVPGAMPAVALVPVAAPAETTVLVATHETAAPRAFADRTVTLGRSRNDASTTLSIRAFALAPIDADGLVARSGQGAPLDWLNGVQFSPVPSVRADDLLSEARRLREGDARSLEHRPSSEGQVEMTAFKYQK